MMNDAMELRHSTTEKVRFLLVSCLVIAIYTGLCQVPRLRDIVPVLMFIGVLQIVLFCIGFYSRYIALDGSGVTYHLLLKTRRVSWAEIGSYTAEWSEGYDDFVDRSRRTLNLRGNIALFNANGRRLLEFNVDFGTRAERERVRTILMERLASFPDRDVLEDQQTGQQTAQL